MPPKLSIVIPAFNEAARIVPSLGKIRQFLLSAHLEAEVLVVDDGSTDETAEAVESQIRLYESVAPLRLLVNPGNRGKGYSVRHGVLKSQGEEVLFSDTDLSAPIEEYHKLASPLHSGQASVAFGSRALEESQIQIHQSWVREYGGRSFNLLVRILAGLPFRDTQCGFKLFTRAAADAVFSRQTVDRFGFDVEILYIARKLGFRIVEVPVVWNNAAGSRVRLLSDGFRMILDVLRVRYQDLCGRYNGGRDKSSDN